MTPRQEPCQESSSVPANQDSGYKANSIAFFIIIRSIGLKSTGRAGGFQRFNLLMRNNMRFFLGSCLEWRCNNAAIGPQGEKAIPARSTAISGKTEQAKQPRECSGPMLAGYSRKIHVAAHIAMHETDIRYGNRPCVKSRIATTAAPRPQKSESNHIILYTFPTRAAGAV